MLSNPVFYWSLGIFLALAALTWETVREFRQMEKDPRDYTGSDRLAGSAE